MPARRTARRGTPTRRFAHARVTWGAKVPFVHPGKAPAPSTFLAVTPRPRRLRRLGALIALAPLVPFVGGSAAGAGAPQTTNATTLSAEAVPLRADTRAFAPSFVHANLLSAVGTIDAERRIDLEPFVAIGFSWLGGEDEIGIRIQLADGSWTEPNGLHAEGAQGDGSTETTDEPRLYTDALAVGASATGYEVTLPAGLTNVRVHFVREDPNGVHRLETAGAADGIPGPDGIRARAAWGARERNPTSPCGSGAHPEGLGCVADSGVNNAIVHHTVNANSYAASSVPEMLRAIQTFHMDVRGWDDIAYNFVVDRFGTIWEGRGGGADRPVIGAHVAGFNTGSVGVSVLGTFDSAAPTAAALEGVAQVIAYKLAQRNVDPLGNTVLLSRGGDIHPPGTFVSMPNIASHRDLGQTSCPGQLLYDRLSEIRQRVAELLPLYTGELPDLDRFNGQMRVGGFALRRDSASPVSVRLEIDGATVATATADRPRSDVAERFGALGAAHGFEFTLPVSLSMRRACIFETVSGVLIGCRDVNPITPPFGDFSTAVGSTGPPRIDIGGWAIEPDDSGNSPLHVYVDGVFATTVWTGEPRSDVASSYPRYGANRGFKATLSSTLGPHTVCVYAINVPAGNHTSLGCRAVSVGRVDTAAPRGSLDVVRMEGPDVSVQGWAFDADTTAPIPLHVYVDGAMNGQIWGDVARPDVAAAFPGSGAAHGFSSKVRLAPGAHNVCVYAINDNLVGPHTLLGCRGIDVPIPNLAMPSGSLDAAVGFLQLIVVAGWAADPDSGAPIPVHVYVDGTFHTITAAARRTDVATVFPAFGPDRGFVGVIEATPGTHHVCAYAINDNLVGPHRPLGCRTVVVAEPNATPPIGSLDVVSVQGASLRVAGWALDPDAPGPIPVHVYVGGAGLATVAQRPRPDIPIALPGRDAAHGFDLTLPLPSGVRRICVYAINDNPAAAHTTLGCRSI
jgi:hypothetical protein